MNPSHGAGAGTFNAAHSPALSYDDEESANHHLATIEEDVATPKMQEGKSFWGKDDSKNYDGDSDSNIDIDRDTDSDSNSDNDSSQELTFSEPEKTKQHVNFFGNKLFEKYSNKPKKTRYRESNSENGISGMYRQSMMSVETENFEGGTVKPLKTWYRSLVIRQSCHSQMAEELMAYDMYLNTISVAMTAVTSSAIFTSLVPSDGGGQILALSAGILAAFNTVLQAIMKTLAYNRRGEQHLAAFKMFTRMRFKMENLIGDRKSYTHHEGINDKMLNEWIEKYEELLESEPVIPQDILEEVSEKEDKAGLKWTRATTALREDR